MKTSHIKRILLAGAFALCIAACNNNSKNNSAASADTMKQAPAPTAQPVHTDNAAAAQAAYKKPTPAEAKFKDLRLTAFAITPVDLKITVPIDKDGVYVVVFELETDGFITTVATYLNVDVALT